MFIKNFTQVSKNDVAEVGGKGASLGEMTQVGIPVPPGFVVTTETFKQFSNSELPTDVIEQIYQAFDLLGAQRVAVRSSAVAEDSSSASWAGQLESYLNTTRENLIDRIRDCWNSIKSERALAYAENRGVIEEDLLVAVVVQKMVESEVAGVIFTANPITKNNEEIMIEAGYGLGEMLVQGMITPDNFLVDKNTFEIKERNIDTQETKLVYQDGENKEIPVPENKKSETALTDEQIIELAKLGQRIEDHYGFPVDIEWALEKDKFYIVQSRPVTTLATEPAPNQTESDLEPILRGVAAAQGVVSGPVRLIKELDEAANLKIGEVLVAEKTSPDFVEAFGRAIAVVTDSGGITSHAAIVARELGIPAVVGTKNATQILKDGLTITVDGNNGLIFEGVNTGIESRKSRISLIGKSTGDPIEDFLNSTEHAFNDIAEFWPIFPTQLFGYIDEDQAIDMFNKMKKIQNEGKKLSEIALLFERPHLVRSFLLNSGIIGIKIAGKFKMAPVEIKDQVEFFSWFYKILETLTQRDPFCLRGMNVILSDAEVDQQIEQNDWFKLDSNNRSTLNLLTANLFALSWAFGWDYFDAAATELHGPYELKNPKFGQKSFLLIRDFFEIPTEIWPLAKKIPFKSIRMSQIYNKKEIFINFANRIIGESPASYLSHFNLVVDGKNINKKEEIRELALILAKIVKEQAEFVNKLNELDKVRKGAMLAYYCHKKFYQQFNPKWYPEEIIENSIKQFGTKWLNEGKNPTNQTLEVKRKLFDPRNDFLMG